MEIRELKLMIPGPIQPEEEVLEAMGRPVLPHYGPQWTQLYNETTGMLKTIFRTNGDVFLFVGPGSSAVEGCIGSAVGSHEKIIIGINGFFGERLAHIARSYLMDVVPVEAEWGEPLRAAAVADAIRRHPDVRAIAMVHLETSTTVVNPVEEIGRVARQHNVPLIVDAVSSLGGLPLDMDEWGIDFCAAASQKCLGAPPGIAPVAVGERGWQAVDRLPNPGHGWYLNVRTWRQYVQEWGHFHPFPTTQATNNVVALRCSLKKLLAEGIEARLQRYSELALYLRQNLRRIGYEPFTPDENMAPVLTAAYGPPGIPTGQIVSYLEDKHGIKIAGGLGPQLANKIIRIGHMSPTVSQADIDEVIAALEAFEAQR